MLLRKDYYNINDFGLWQKERYVLIRNSSDVDFSKKHKVALDSLTKMIKNWKEYLQKARLKKEKPNLDDKVLTSWNALMIKGYIDAYRALKDKNYLAAALKNANFILNNQLKKDGNLYRNLKNGKSSIPAFSEDYATLIEAFLSLYEVTLNEKWLTLSKKLMDYCLAHFFNEQNSMFYFSSNNDNNLISRKVKVIDNVIASPNSILANCLFKLNLYYADANYKKIAYQMISNLQKDVIENPEGYSNWLSLMTNYTNPFYEIVSIGKEAHLKNDIFLNFYHPNVVLAGDIKNNNSVPLLKDKFVKDETYIYVCNFGTCKIPQQKVNEAIKFIKK